MFKNAIAIGKASGTGEWGKILELAEDDDYVLKAYVYEKLEDIENSKKYYYLALNEDENNVQAIQQISMLYASEKNHNEAYKYIQMGLKLVKYENNYGMQFFSLLIDILKKIFHPSYSFSKMRKVSKDDIAYSNEWLIWALEYKNWYKKNIQNS
jgi:tetratricopeptide (TPR) repeat protein